MKIRNGFVSNSSSSSFVCDICNGVEEGYDGLAEIGMVDCEYGHVFHTSCAENYTQIEQYRDIPKDDLINMIIDRYKAIIAAGKKKASENLPIAPGEITEEMIEEFYEDKDHVTPLTCPLCTLKFIQCTDAYTYLLKKYNLSANSVGKEIQGKFSSILELNKYEGNN